MEGLRLLARARLARLSVSPQDDKLVIRGPKTANAIAQELIQQKTSVFTALAAATRDAPAQAIFKGAAYDVAYTSGIWFFRLVPEAGWTGCSDESVRMMEEQWSNSAGD
jgi:hypothetical protein